MLDLSTPWIKLLGIFDSKSNPDFHLLSGTRTFNFFVEYCYFDIPVGYEFSKILNSDGVLIYRNPMILKNVNQQFNIVTDTIPLGWKTVCSIEFKDGPIPKGIFDFSVINSWYESRDYFILTN
ncbi:MAG: hypothetical protein JNK20_13675 [Flavipsychrobacter sp.]|nr:hypothetical protein [Flavipsychrobacter sp.]